MSIHARTEPIRNVRRTFTGMNHLQIDKEVTQLKGKEKEGQGEELRTYDRAELTRLPNCLM